MTIDTKTLLEVKNLCVDYHASNGVVHAVNDVSFSLQRGEILGLAGESGCGKSTLAYAIARLLNPPAMITAGSVIYHAQQDAAVEVGQRNSSKPKHNADEAVNIMQLSGSQLRAFRWNELSIVFQSAMNALNPVMKIKTQIVDVLRTHRPTMTSTAQKQRAIELMEMVGIAPDRLNSYPHELSGGMRQRAIIAIALALQPDLIIMDEPTTALDVVVQREILELISGLCKETNTALIFITHDLSLLIEIADKIAIMYAGKMIEKASSRDTYLHPRHPYSYGLLNAFPTIHGPRRKMVGIPGSPPDLRKVPAGCAFHPRCPLAFSPCSSIIPELQPATAETSTQLTACHLYNPTFNTTLPDTNELAAKYAVLAEGNDAIPFNKQPEKLNGALTTTGPILEAKYLRKFFPVNQINPLAPKRVVHAVEDTSLALYPGRATALVGESGSGKTTVARMLARIYNPTSGTIRLQGKAVNLESGATLRQYRRAIQLIFQDPFSSLNPLHDVRYHLSRSLRIFGHVHNEVEETQQILALLNRVSLTPPEQFIQKFPHQLSGGQRQRVAIARALAARPTVLLADEPVSMLDVSIRLDILNLLLRLKNEEQLALLFITHDIASARYFAEDTVAMYAGQMVEGGPSEEVIQRPKHPYTQLLLSAAPDPTRLGPDGKNMVPLIARGEIPSLITPPNGCRFHPRCPHAMPVCKERYPRKTELGRGHWTHCFLYGDGDTETTKPNLPVYSTDAHKS